MSDATMLSAAELRELVHYDPDTGVFTRRAHVNSRAPAGAVCGSVRKYGYLEFRVKGRLHKAHRLAWLYMTGEWPARVIDHINGITSDNRWANLRHVDCATNIQNMRRPMKTNQTTGVLGVTFSKKYKHFKAQLSVDGKTKYLGVFKTAEDASAAYLAAKRTHHPGCTL